MFMNMTKCMSCTHYYLLEESPWCACKAFPEYIPREIFSGEIDHEKESYPGDNGIHYEPAEKPEEGK